MSFTHITYNRILSHYYQIGWLDYDMVLDNTIKKFSGADLIIKGDIFYGEGINIIVTDILERDIKGSLYGCIHGPLHKMEMCRLESFTLKEISSYALDKECGYYWINYWGNNPDYSDEVKNIFENLKLN